MLEPKRIGTFEQVGAAFARHHSGRQPIVRSITINLTAEHSQRFEAARKRYGGGLSAEAFASLAIQAGLPKLMEQS